MKHCNVEHYVVKPNTPVYDWPYEYSQSSNSGNSNNCCCNSEALMVTIGNLLSTLASLQNAITEASTGNIDPQQIEEAVNRYISAEGNADALKQLIDSEIVNKFGMTTPNDIQTLKQNVNSIMLQISSLSPVVNNITKLTELTNLDVQKLSQYGDQITQVSADLTALESRLSTLEGRVDSISDNMVDAINDAVDAKLNDSTLLTNKVDELVNNNSTIAQLQGNLTDLQQDLTDHINDDTKHFKNGDIHVTQEMVNQWNSASGSTSTVDFSVEDKTLVLTK